MLQYLHYSSNLYSNTITIIQLQLIKLTRNFKSASRFALGRFRNYSPDYFLNCTPLGPITITNYIFPLLLLFYISLYRHKSVQAHENTLCTHTGWYGIAFNHNVFVYNKPLHFLDSLTQCQMARQNSSRYPFGSSHLIRCKQDGSYQQIQCSGTTGYCWCVDENGVKLTHTETRGSLRCPVLGRFVISLPTIFCF